LRTLLKLRLALPIRKLDVAGDRSRTRWRFGLLRLWNYPVITSQSAAIKVSLLPKVFRCCTVAILRAPNWRTASLPEINLRPFFNTQLTARLGTILVNNQLWPWKDNIKRDLQEVGGGCGDWIERAQDRNSWRALVSTVMNFRVP
jgi:hypothetical protein